MLRLSKPASKWSTCRVLIRKRKLMPKEAPVEIEVVALANEDLHAWDDSKCVEDDEPLQFKGKVQRKPLALLKAIIAFGGRHVREETLIDRRSGRMPKATQHALHLTSAIHRLSVICSVMKRQSFAKTMK